MGIVLSQSCTPAGGTSGGGKGGKGGGGRGKKAGGSSDGCAGFLDGFYLGGQRLDPGGLYHMGARYQDPILGQFTQPDPSDDPDPATPQTLNRYAYVYNNPVQLIDPSGYEGHSGDENENNHAGGSPGMASNNIGGTPSMSESAAAAGYPNYSSMINGFGFGVHYSKPGPINGTFGARLSALASMEAGAFGFEHFSLEYPSVALFGVRHRRVATVATTPLEFIDPRARLDPAFGAWNHAQAWAFAQQFQKTQLGSLAQAEVTRRGKMRGNPRARGPHTQFKIDPQTGQVRNYQGFYRNPRTGKFEPGIRVDRVGAAHRGVPTPHMHVPGVREAIPLGPEHLSPQARVGRAAAGAGCFVAGTPVVMADGSWKPIEQVKVGDWVMSFCEQTQRLVAAPVTAHLVHEDRSRRSPIVVINGALEATGNHPFYVDGRWIEADNLALGARLTRLAPSFDGLVAAGTTDVLVSSLERRGGAAVVYNLEVGLTHTYFAGGVLVHNKMQFQGRNVNPFGFNARDPTGYSLLY